MSMTLTFFLWWMDTTLTHKHMRQTDRQTDRKTGPSVSQSINRKKGTRAYRLLDPIVREKDSYLPLPSLPLPPCLPTYTKQTIIHPSVGPSTRKATRRPQHEGTHE
mmetsp:Transcript_10222/g.29538  ORF Transcript_10222/g.29538 Transcript_10222/m.29538 type:complete len:106 (+) Transcript_10222:1904-2221(+)